MTSIEPRPIVGVHHAAFRCRDAEQTIWFYRDVLGLADPTGIIVEEVPGSGADDPYLHVFFRMRNGEHIAFFDAPGSADPAWFARKDSFDMHWAFEVGGEDDLIAMRDRIRAHGVTAHGPIDHHFVRPQRHPDRADVPHRRSRPHPRRGAAQLRADARPVERAHARGEGSEIRRRGARPPQPRRRVRGTRHEI
jgi:catechol 2,3-dioxygenase-like lactoylglutathione lyase family enzyme